MKPINLPDKNAVTEHKLMVIKAQSPTGLTEQHLIKGIWNGRFPPGSILPAERALSDILGVTRPTLREVLQRLACDGWLTIQHGKSTRVNNVWETSGLNIHTLETLAQLDHQGVPQLIDNLLTVRTDIAAAFIPAAFQRDPKQAQEILAKAAAKAAAKAKAETKNINYHAKTYTILEHSILCDLASVSGNQIYGLILNGLKGLYMHVGHDYFSNHQARRLALNFYKQLSKLCTEKLYDEVADCVHHYGAESRELWHSTSNLEKIVTSYSLDSK